MAIINIEFDNEVDKNQIQISIWISWNTDISFIHYFDYHILDGGKIHTKTADYDKNISMHINCLSNTCNL